MTDGKTLQNTVYMNEDPDLGLPPMPFMFSIAAASNLEKVPESWSELQDPKRLIQHFINAPKLS